MRRPLFLSLPAALLAACAGQDTGIETAGGDAFVLARADVSGVAAVEQGLAQAQGFCGEHGRLFVLTGSEVASSGYRLGFRCVAPNNVPPLAAASAPPSAPPPARAQRARRGPPPAETSTTGPALAFAASLPPLDKDRPMVASWQPADANLLPPPPVVTSQPLFVPPAGQSLVASAPAPRRMPPPDDSPMVPLPRLEGGTVAAAPSPEGQAQPAILREAPPMAAPAEPPGHDSLPVITASQPLPGYGLVVASPDPLPGAPSSLPPIAGPARMPAFPPAPAPGFPTGTSSFTQGGFR